jgi:hypothetical protein
MRLRRPGDAAELLGIVLAAARQRRRLVFFCSCPSPEGSAWCHRHLARRALLREAARINQPLRIEEWPGGTLPLRIRAEVRVTPEALAAIRRGRKTVPLGKGFPSVELLDLPSYSLVLLRARQDEQLVSVLPARFSARGWDLPIGLGSVLPEDKAKDLLPSAQRERRYGRLEASNA